MAIDSIPFAPSDDYALPDKTFYPLDIPVSHWQLRHYISHSDPDVLYYASGTEVYYLNVSTRKRKHIATLPFEARCTASGHGYVCIGGEYKGHFAVIKLEEGRRIDVDVAVPLDHWRSVHGTPRAVDIKVERIGGSIVNSISIHKIQDQDAHLYDVVAVLTNNDSTVRIYSLSHGREVSVLDLPDAMNHATISPDGKTLAAVGDVNTVFFFTRSLRKDPPQIPKPHNRLDMSAADWELTGRYTLYIPSPHTQRGYFTTAWSPSGHLLAVGSEAGYITVFDMHDFIQAVEEAGGDIETIRLATIPSSRPNIQAHTCPGAVRSMLFSPDPWDLLIWAEDQGRICIGDLRNALKSKQVVELDVKDKSLNRLGFDEIESEQNVEETWRLLELEEEYAQHRRQEDDGDAVVGAPQEGRPRSRPLESGDEAAFADDPNGLTADEQSVLESLRDARRQQEDSVSGGLPTSINYTSAGQFDHPRGDHERTEPSSRNQRYQQGGASSHARSDDFFSRQLQMLRNQHQATSRYYAVNETDQTTNEYMLPPIRRMEERSQRGTSNNDQFETTPSTRSEGPSTVPPHALRAPSETSRREQDDGPWRIISDAMNLARGPLFDSSSSEQVRLLSQQQDRLRTLQRDLEAHRYNLSTSTASTVTMGSESLGTGANAIQPSSNRYAFGFELGRELLRRRPGVNAATRRPPVSAAFPPTGHEIGVRTAGLAVSRDGRTVWAATEQGVFEIALNVKSRSRWPAVDLR